MGGYQILIIKHVIIFLILLFLSAPALGEDKMTPSDWPENKVLIAPNAILMPPGKILLIRKNRTIYGAIKFTNFWTGESEDDWFAEYISYYQPNLKDGHFGGENLLVKKGKLSSPKPWGIGRLSFSFGKKEIQCGSIKLYWSGKGSVYFYRANQKEGDHGIELSPTNWSNKSEVDFLDSRVQWYKFDPTRQRSTINIDQLWSQ